MVVCEVRDPIDVFNVQRCIVAEATGVGFPRRACTELAIVGSELTSNILKYGVRGSIEISRVEDANGRGLSLVANDAGPPFRDLESALKDGWDDQGPIDPLHMHRRKGIGGGLGAIVRLSHSFRVEPATSGAPGKRIHVVRYLTAPRPAMGGR
jgi:anti-sigma regulatory factor (Ser/Thr protein kinase)